MDIRIIAPLLGGAFVVLAALLTQRFVFLRQKADHSHARELAHEARLFTRRQEAGDRFVTAALGAVPVWAHVWSLSSMWESYEDGPGMVISLDAFFPRTDLSQTRPEMERMGELMKAAGLLRGAGLSALHASAGEIVRQAVEVHAIPDELKDSGAHAWVHSRLQEHFALVDAFAKQLSEELALLPAADAAPAHPPHRSAG
ncbi:hypothetical protein [Streptomyces sp. NPDC001054]